MHKWGKYDGFEWKRWRREHLNELLHDCGLPMGLLESERTWLDFLMHAYAEEPVAFDVEQLTREHLAALRSLLPDGLLPQHRTSSGCLVTVLNTLLGIEQC